MRTQRREFSAKHWENANQKSRETTEQTFAREAGRPRECLSRDNVNAQCTDKSQRQLAQEIAVSLHVLFIEIFRNFRRKMHSNPFLLQ